MTDLAEHTRTRAKPLSVDDRRAMIVDAVIPLIIEHGRDVSTKQIAEAADIAEGTIFRVFDDKDALFEAAVDKFLDPSASHRALKAIDPQLPLEAKVNDILFLLRSRLQGVFGIMRAIGRSGPPPRTPQSESLEDIIAEVLKPDLAQLRVSADRAAAFVRLIAFASAIPPINTDHEISTADLARLVTQGIAGSPAEGEARMLLRLLRTYLRPHWKLLVGVVIFQLASSIAILWLPSLNASIIDNGVIKGNSGYILEFGGIMLLVTLAQVACAIVAVYFGAKTAMSLGRDLRGSVFHRVSEFSEREVAKFSAPSLITRTTNDVQQVQILVLMTCTMLVSAPILAIGGVIAALQQDVGLSWILAIAVPLMLIAIGSIIIRVVPQFRLMQARIDTVNRVLREQLMGIRVVRAFVREKVETERFDLANRGVTATALKSGRLFALVFPLVTLIMYSTSVAVYWFGAARVNDGTLQIGTLTAFISYIIQILVAVMMASFMAIMIPRAAVSADRLWEVLSTESSVVPPIAPVTELRQSGMVELRGVSFAYPGADAPVLHHLDFTASAGTTTAIIGSTGAGKTTLISLLPRLFDATDGEVLVDGVDVRDLDPDLLWSRIGLVPQKAYLFTGTVASNLRYGNPEATDEELWAALETAQAKDFVFELPQQLEAEVSQGGSNFSGGQRQRLAIARALVKKPEILVFDDSFSALDTRTDMKLRAALTKSARDMTRIVVAQRVSTILDADQILVLDHGEIVGRGTHAELLASNPTYAEIVDSQLRAEAAA